MSVGPSDTICNGTPLTFTASPAHYTAYNFLVNGVSVQTSQNPVFNRTLFNTADKVAVVASDFNNCPDTSASIALVVNPIPTIGLTSTMAGPVCRGSSVKFNITPAGLHAYTFYNGSAVLQTGASASFTLNGLNAPAIITATDSTKYCSSVPSQQITLNPIDHLNTPVVNCGVTTPSSI